MELAVQQRKRNLENKVPELKKALAVVQLLVDKQAVCARVRLFRPKRVRYPCVSACPTLGH